MVSKVPSFDLDRMQIAAEEATAALQLLANPDRLLLLCHLSQGEKSVGELEALLDLHQPSLSQQLGVLRAEEVVQTRRVGRFIYYSISNKKILVLLETLYKLYCPAKQGNKQGKKYDN